MVHGVFIQVCIRSPGTVYCDERAMFLSRYTLVSHGVRAQSLNPTTEMPKRYRGLGYSNIGIICPPAIMENQMHK